MLTKEVTQEKDLRMEHKGVHPLPQRERYEVTIGKARGWGSTA